MLDSGCIPIFLEGVLTLARRFMLGSFLYGGSNDPRIDKIDIIRLMHCVLSKKFDGRYLAGM